MKYNSDFAYDLEVGKVGEHTLGWLLSESKLEVKTDFGTEKTGNVFVEYHSRGKPSGISTTQADNWAFVISMTQFIIIDTTHLKEIARRYIGTSRDVLGGDENTSKGVLIPVEELVKPRQI